MSGGWRGIRLVERHLVGLFAQQAFAEAVIAQQPQRHPITLSGRHHLVLVDGGVQLHQPVVLDGEQQLCNRGGDLDTLEIPQRQHIGELQSLPVGAEGVRREHRRRGRAGIRGGHQNVVQRAR